MSRVSLSGRLVCASETEVAAVIATLPEHMRLSRAEPGCLSFEVTQTADPLVWRVEEAFVDRAAFEVHPARTKASEWGRATAGIVRDYEVREG